MDEMATTFNVAAFETRIIAAEKRATNAQKNCADMDQRVKARMERLSTAKAKARKVEDEALRAATVGKLDAERKAAEHDAGKAAANAEKLAFYVQQLRREGELKAARAAARGTKAGKAPAAWGIKTVDGKVTPIQEQDGTLGRLVGRAKKAEVPVGAFAYCLGNECVDMVNNLDNTLLVVNEMSYAIDLASKTGTVVLTKV